MSTSIALVTCAEVSSERRMCSAMPFRIADIGSKLSPGCAAAGGGTGGGVRRGGGGGLGGGAGRGRLLGCGRLCTRLDEAQDVLLGHAAAAPGALDLARVDPVL